MLPARPVLVPIFERLLEMKLHGVNQLPLSALHHHLVATEIRRREQLESFRHAIDLQSMVLPDAQDTRRRLRIHAVNVREDRIFRLGDTNEAILVLLRSLQALLVLLEFVECDHSCSKTQADELMTAADREPRRLRLANERAEAFENRWLVVVEVAGARDLRR